ncbi:TadE/TadG family type IV pilus assembly protein [Xylophilus sp. GW821-FHT01B05]
MNKAARRTALARGARGQSATEFLILLPVLVLLCTAILQFGLLYQAKATLDYAALQAARAGAVGYGQMDAMRSGLADGLTPLFARSADATGLAKAKWAARSESRDGQISRIDVLNPTSTAMRDFARRGTYAGQTIRQIPNDTLMYRDERPGSASGLSIQDANLLKIRVRYCYSMFVPFANRTIHAVFGLFSSNPCGSGGLGDTEWRLPLESDAMVRMQTPYRGS